ncbi:MAG TPA: flagellin [Caulobacteraceae bacterium]|nr:flagellin [Caulobacteraceae bacterium]
MTVSVHTNTSAMIALQQLNKTNDQLEQVQSRINTGLKVNGAKDNASVWAVAQGQRADIGALSAVKMSMDRATSIADVTLTAGETISDLLNEMKEKVTAAMDPSIDSAARGALNADYKALLRQVRQIVDNAEFDGANMLNGSLTAPIRFLANADADAYVTLSVKNLSLGGSIITMAATSSINTATNATAVLAQLSASIVNVNSAMGDIGAQAKQIEAHNTFISKLTDVLESGIGNLVDADMAKESARLQALQVQQQLGAQALNIANSAPQVILSLFKG